MASVCSTGKRHGLFVSRQSAAIGNVVARGADDTTLPAVTGDRRGPKGANFASAASGS